jgi:hypothetical protein
VLWYRYIAFFRKIYFGRFFGRTFSGKDFSQERSIGAIYLGMGEYLAAFP